MKKNFTIIFFSLFLFSCGENKENGIVKNDYNPKEWNCIIDDTLMYSKKINGYEIGGAQKGCSCKEIESFEIKTFGKVDYNVLKADFGCNIPENERIKSSLENENNIKTDNHKYLNTTSKTEKELFIEQLKKITGEKNEKISDLMIIDKIDFKKENYKNILEYSYTINTEKNKDIDLTPIKNNTLNNINNPEDKEDLEFIENIKKFNIYLRYKYFDINGKYFGGFEIKPYEINLYENNFEKIEKPKINYGKTEKVITSNTNLRKFPGKNSERIRVLQKGEKVFFYDSQYLIEKDGYNWLYITTEKGVNGYIVIDGIQ